MASENMLIQLPELPMKVILEKLDFISIQCLRKTCHDLRNIIEDLKPGPSELQFVIQLEKDSVDFLLGWPVPSQEKWKKNREGHQVLASEDTLHLIHRKIGGKTSNFWSENSCEVTYEAPNPQNPVKTKILKNRKFLDVFTADLKCMLEQQKATVIFKNFILIVGKDCEKKTKKLYENLKNIFEAKSPEFKIRDLRIHTFGGQEVMTILPYVNAEQLEHLKIENAKDVNEVEPLENFEEIVNLKQWKKLTDVLTHGFSIPLRIQDYFHFTSFGIHVPNISTRDIIAMKNNMLAGSNLQSGCFYFKFMEDDWQLLNQEFGRNRMQPDIEFPKSAVWEVPIPGENSAILIMFNDGFVSFQRLAVVVSSNLDNIDLENNRGGGDFFGRGGVPMFGAGNAEIAGIPGAENDEMDDDDDL